jgi:hypothetical protein
MLRSRNLPAFPKLMFNRRQFLLIAAALAALDYGRSVVVMRAGEPPGWKTERWQAGFGSWGRGGFRVAYDISMPETYDFQQKCGRAWITDDTDDSDFSVRLSFSPTAKDRELDFNDYLKEDAGGNNEADFAALKMGEPANFRIGELEFSRLDFTRNDAKSTDDAGGKPRVGSVRGFRLQSGQLSIIADMRDSERAAIDERIVGSIRRAAGHGLTELLAGTIPGLLGC